MNTTVAARASKHTSGLTRFIPILGWLPRYERAWLGIDVIAVRDCSRSYRRIKCMRQ